MGIGNRIISLFSGYNWLIIPAAFFAIVFHEICHGYIAFLLGDRTAKDRGRLSLNPIKHMDPIGLIAMVIFGFGWAKPVPINPNYFKNKKLGMSLVSIAGPASNIFMAAISLLFVRGILMIPDSGQFIVKIFTLILNFCYISAILNVGLAVFNLLPIPPLDGSKILFALLPQRAYGFVLKYEQIGFIILIVLLYIPFFSNVLTILRTWLFDLLYTLIL